MKGLHILDLENEILMLCNKMKKKKKKNKKKLAADCQLMSIFMIVYISFIIVHNQYERGDRPFHLPLHIPKL
jgi:hypothetical protein